MENHSVQIIHDRGKCYNNPVINDSVYLFGAPYFFIFILPFISEAVYIIKET